MVMGVFGLPLLEPSMMSGFVVVRFKIGSTFSRVMVSCPLGYGEV